MLPLEFAVSKAPASSASEPPPLREAKLNPLSSAASPAASDTMAGEETMTLPPPLMMDTISALERSSAGPFAVASSSQLPSNRNVLEEMSASISARRLRLDAA